MRSDLQIETLAFQTCELDRYLSVPIAFSGHSRLDSTALRAGELREMPEPEFFKDYDLLESPRAWSSQFDTSNWLAFLAIQSHTVGGAILAFGSKDFDMLLGRKDLAVLTDLRVHPAKRGKGVGTCLFRAAAARARKLRCSELHVETQDTNVAACRFYKQLGCTIQRIEEGAYGPSCQELKVVWSLKLMG